MNTKVKTRKRVSATELRSYRKLLLVNSFEPMIIGRRIAQARQESGGMTQEELADLLGVSTRSVQGYEAGDVIPWKYFSRLEEIFNHDLGWFLERGEVVPDAETLDRRLRALEEAVAASADATARSLESLAEGIARIEDQLSGEAGRAHKAR